MESVDPCDAAAVIAALGVRLGLEGEPLLKASYPRVQEDPDPRHPGLDILIRRAQRNWDRYGLRLLAAVGKLLKKGQLLPLRASSEALLGELLQAHRSAVAVHLYKLPDPEVWAKVVRVGIARPEDPAPVPMVQAAWRLGRALSSLQAPVFHRGPPPEEKAVLERAAAVPLSAVDAYALDWAARRSGAYIRRPVGALHDGLRRTLTSAQEGAVRQVVTDTINQGLGAGTAARHMRLQMDAASVPRMEATTTRILQNRTPDIEERFRSDWENAALQSDFRRIIRTEMHTVYATGAYLTLKEQAAAAGHPDPSVYKLARSGACLDCKRIWGTSAKPEVYKLSDIEDWEEGGGNFQKPREEWRATIGPTHPNCTEGPLLFFSPELHRSVISAADDLDRLMGR